MENVESNSVNMICTHPPYANIIEYSNNIYGDISRLNYKEFLIALKDVAKESKRVLKKNGICAYMIGDIIFKGNIHPLGFNSLEMFMGRGFKLKEIITKEQYDRIKKRLLIKKLILAHDRIFVLEKI